MGLSVGGTVGRLWSRVGAGVGKRCGPQEMGEKSCAAVSHLLPQTRLVYNRGQFTEAM